LFDICIIGGGVVGCALARELTRYQLKILLLEKSDDVAEGISKANSGVIHSGFNIKPGTLKARLNVEALGFYPKLAHDLDVPYKLNKKMVIGNTEAELGKLKSLLSQGLANRVPGLSIISEKQIQTLEPEISAKYALFSEKTAIISPTEFTIALAENACCNGASILLNSEVMEIHKNPSGYFSIKTSNNTYTSKIVINSAGLNADAVASMVGEYEVKISPCRGEYYILDKGAADLLNMSVYPVPPADGSGLGVHLTPTVHGNVLIGPSAEYINDKYDVSNTAEVMETLKKEAFQILPRLREIPFIKNYSGIRPKLFSRTSEKTFEDFIIEEHPSAENFINLIGIESPGLTASPAIARYVIEELISNKIDLKENKNFQSQRKGIKRIKSLSVDEINSLIGQNPDYGKIICRCEQISKGELLEAINNPLGAKSLSAIKKRTHATAGRCQSGFCLPQIIDLMELDLS